MIIERDWTHCGLRCIVVKQDRQYMHHRCGYVAVPAGHPLHGVGYSDQTECLRPLVQKVENGPIGKRGVITLFCASKVEPTPEIIFDVHGSLTFAGEFKMGTIPNAEGLWLFGFDCNHCDDSEDEWTEDAVAQECELLADQIAGVLPNKDTTP